MMHWLIWVMVFFMLLFSGVSTTTDSIIFAEELSKVEQAYIITKMPSEVRKEYFNWIKEGDRIMADLKSNKISSRRSRPGQLEIFTNNEEFLGMAFYAKVCYERAHMILMRYRTAEEKK